MSESKVVIGSLLIGLFIGGVAGATASLMISPQSGTETLNKIGERATELGRKATSTAQSTVI
jgi:gas vesicle protein